jgi:HlyD family secretion protein
MKAALWPLGLLAIAALTGCGGNNGQPGGSGLLEADEVVVSAETGGQVVLLRFDRGTELHRGDTLAVIDPSRLELDLASALAGQKVAQAGLSTARIRLEQASQTERYACSELDRVSTLLQAGTSTQKQFDQLQYEHTQAVIARRTAEAGVVTVQAELEKIDADIARIRRLQRDCYPVAPQGGTVTEKYIEQGELLSPGKPIAKISRLDTLWVKVYLPSGDFAHVQLGDKADVSTESGGKTYGGTVIWASEEAEFTPKNVQTKESRADLVYAVKVRIVNTDGSLKIGMPVFVTLETK